MSFTSGNAGGAQFNLAVAGTAVTLTVPTSARGAVIDNSGSATIRYTTDGTTPSATAGNRLAAGGSLVWDDPETNYYPRLVNLKMIRETATSSTVEVQYYTYS